MKTIEEIKSEILSQNPSRTSTINGETIELTDEDFADAIEKRAAMQFEQIKLNAEKQIAEQNATAKLLALGLTTEDLKALGLG